MPKISSVTSNPTRRRCSSGVSGEFLADYTAHEHIAGIGNKRDEGELEIGSVTSNNGKGCVFACRGIVEETGEKSLHRIEPCIAGCDTECEGNDEIAQRNRDAVMDAFEEYVPAGLHESRLDIGQNKAFFLEWYVTTILCWNRIFVKL